MIDLIRRRPGMFLGSNSISALRNFLDGYQTAEREHAIYYQAEELFPLPFEYMHEYAAYRLRNRNSMGWSHQILNSCNGVEDVALQKFFEFYDGFIRVRMRRYWKAILTEDNIAWNDQMKGAYRCTGRNTSVPGLYTMDDLSEREPIYRNPLAAYVIELTIPVCILAVETATDIRLERWFFPSPEKAQKSTKSYFGPIDSWEEFTARNISFGKNIMI